MSLPDSIFDEQPWPEPRPLTVDTEPVPFPTWVLPPWMQAQVEAAAQEMQCPPDLPAQLGITALSIVCAGHAQVLISSTWREPLNTYLVTGLRPGENKSPNFKMMLNPVNQWERELQDATERERGRIETKRKVLLKQYTRCVDKGEMAEALAIQDEMDALPPTHAPRLMADDSTPEKVVDLLRTHNGRMAITSTEGGVFDAMTGRYSDRANLDVYLQAWSGDTIRVDRIGREGAIVHDPCLTIGLTVQPSVIEKLAEVPDLRGRGLTSRFMYSVPASMVGYRDMRRLTVVDPAVTSTYRDRIIALAERMAALGEVRVMVLSQGALDAFTAFRMDLEERRQPGRDLIGMVEWSIKMESTTMRLAGLLHLADGGAPDGAIDAQTAERAIEVGRYWTAHARIAHELWLPDPVTQAAGKVAKWIVDGGHREFTIRDAYGALRRVMPKAEDAIEPLAVLVDKCWIRPAEGDEIKTVGRGKPSPRVVVNPAVFTESESSARMRAECLKPQKSSNYLSVEIWKDGEGRAHCAHGSHFTPEQKSVDNPPAAFDDADDPF